MNEKHVSRMADSHIQESSARRSSASFSEDEIRTMNELFAVLRRGGDASVIARSENVKKVMTKFHGAAERLRVDQ